jgi:E3 SUMO-protein ligase RanBP2
MKLFQLLRNNDTKKVRLVMRRDQVHKVCANHSITPQMKLTPMSKSDRAWVWSCQDFSEGVLTDETFAAKFKDPELADKFRVAFETALTGGAAVNGSQPATATPKGAAVFGNGFRLSHTSPPAPSPSAFGGGTSSSVFGGGTGSSIFGGGTSADVKPTEATSTTTAAMVTTTVTAPSTSPSTFVFGGLAFGQAKPAVKKEESAAAVPTTTATTNGQCSYNLLCCL